MSGWYKRRSGLSAALIVIAAGLVLWASQDSGLAAVHQRIAFKHPSVEHMKAEDFSDRALTSMVVFDTREADEFAVSHLPGAIRIPPELPRGDFLERYGDLVAGKTVVFYCSVGGRSTQYAEQVQARLRDIGAVKVVNLEGGLFGWHNDARPLMNSSNAATDAIHPYDDFWGRLIDRQALISRDPKIFGSDVTN